MIQIDKELWQWDLNRFVTVDERCEVHFALIGSSEALVVDSTDGKAEIPNILLQDGRDILAWTVVNDRTEEQKYLSVAERARPSDYVYEETDVKRAEQLLQEVTELAEKVRESVSAMNQTEFEVSENEKSRVESEYKRAEAESLRVAAETSRAKAETERQKAETERESAEESRKDEWDAQKFIVSTEWEECKDSIESQFDTLTTDFESNVSSIEDSWDEIKTDAQTTLNEVNAAVAQLPLPDGNVPKGMASGYVSHADDAYAAKPLEVRVYGNTRQNLWVNPSGTSNGVTTTSNADGSITISGTATGYSQLYSEYVHSLTPAKSYTLEIDSKCGGYGFSVFFYSSDGEQIRGYSVGSGQNSILKQTFTVPDGASSARFGYGSQNTSESTQPIPGTYRVMLNEGNTAEPWCPPGINGVKPKELVTAGKNLATSSEATVASEIGTSAYVDISNELPPGTYIVKASDQTGTVNACARKVGSNKVAMWGTAVANGSKFTITTPMMIQLYHNPNDSVAYSVDVTDIQLELGSTATAYEPPYTTEIPISLEEPLMSVGNYADELVIDADGTATVNREVIRLDADSSGWTSFVDNGTTKYIQRAVKPNTTSAGFISIPSNIAVSKDLVANDSFDVPRFACSNGTTVFFRVPSTEPPTNVSEMVEYMRNLGAYCYAPAEPTIESLGTVQLPKLNSPVFNVYTDSNVPHNVEVSYLRDINIALSKLDDAISSIRSTLDTLAQIQQTLPLEGEAEPDEGTTTIETC